MNIIKNQQCRRESWDTKEKLFTKRNTNKTKTELK